MPKIVEYPRASLKKALELAKAVDELSGSCDKRTAAEKMGMKLSGGFTEIISSAAKFGFIKTSKGMLILDQNYKDYKLAYNDEEKIQVLQKSFLGVPLFKKVYEKYKDTKLPIDLLSKVLVREFDVDQKIASRVTTHFINAAKKAKLLNPDNSFNQIRKDSEPSYDFKKQNDKSSNYDNEIEQQTSIEPAGKYYVITIKGPSIDQTIKIEEEDHLMLVEAAMNIIKKRLNANKDDKDENNESSD